MVDLALVILRQVRRITGRGRPQAAPSARPRRFQIESEIGGITLSSHRIQVEPLWHALKSRLRSEMGIAIFVTPIRMKRRGRPPHFKRLGRSEHAFERFRMCPDNGSRQALCGIFLNGILVDINVPQSGIRTQAVDTNLIQHST